LESLPTFELFPDPLSQLNVFERSDAVCDICGQSRGWIYAGVAFGDLDEPDICPWCIHDGSAAKRGVSFNDATQYPYVPATPQLPEDERRLIEDRTPGFECWQSKTWLGCCGRARIFLGEATAQDLLGRWAEAVPSLINDLPWPDDDKAALIRSFRIGGNPSAYAFQCRTCGKLKGFWDDL
jgi:uncharacterized protein CbrC (UPF0167 family)